MTRHQTAANLPPLDSLIIAGNSVFHLTLPYNIREDEVKPTNIISSPVVKDLGKDGMCSGKALISHIGRISTCLLYSDSF